MSAAVRCGSSARARYLKSGSDVQPPVWSVPSRRYRLFGLSTSRSETGVTPGKESRDRPVACG